MLKYFDYYILFVQQFNSIKKSTQDQRGQPRRRVYVTSMMQKMPKRYDWNNFLNSGENQSELLQAITHCY